VVTRYILFSGFAALVILAGCRALEPEPEQPEEVWNIPMKNGVRYAFPHVILDSVYFAPYIDIGTEEIMFYVIVQKDSPGIVRGSDLTAEITSGPGTVQMLMQPPDSLPQIQEWTYAAWFFDRPVTRQPVSQIRLTYRGSSHAWSFSSAEWAGNDAGWK